MSLFQACLIPVLGEHSLVTLTETCTGYLFSSSLGKKKQHEKNWREKLPIWKVSYSFYFTLSTYLLTLFMYLFIICLHIYVFFFNLYIYFIYLPTYLLQLYTSCSSISGTFRETLPFYMHSYSVRSV